MSVASSETGQLLDRPAPGIDRTSRRPPSSSRGARCIGLTKAIVKGIGIAFGFSIVALPAATCRLEAWLTDRDEVFLFWGQAFALVPGLPGKYLRKCYYFIVLKACPLSCDIGFMTCFNDRRSEVGRRVYIGFGVGLGLVSLGDGVLIGSRASLLSGGHQHRFGSDGRLTPFERSHARRVRIGEETWIGEAAVVMADVGSHCIVGAGSIIARSVPGDCIVGGNPARFIRRSLKDDHAPAEIRPS